jgi:hypothetical protein
MVWQIAPSQAQAARNQSCDEFFGTTACIDPGPGGIGVGIGTGGGPGHGGGSGGIVPGPDYEYRLVLACSSNTVDNFTASCIGALTSCGVVGQMRYWVFRRPLTADGRPAGQWLRMPGSVCRAGPNGSPLPTATDIAGAFRWGFVPIAPSRTHFNPANGTLVNADTIFYADTPETFRTNVTLLGQTVALTLHPTKWRWDFGDGHGLTTTTPGAPYPSTAITHRYARSGNQMANVTVTWDGTFTFAGSTVAIPGDTSRPGPATTVVVHEAHAHLVGG